MTEEQAWVTLEQFAQRARVQVLRTMKVTVVRRTLAKVFQPRAAGDDDSAMRAINPALDIIEVERDRRELCGLPEPKWSTASASSTSPNPGQSGSFQTGFQNQPAPRKPANTDDPNAWQTEPGEPLDIRKQDFSDINYLKKSVFLRSMKFGTPNLVKAWSWDGRRFRKVISAYASEFAYEELARGLLVYQAQNDPKGICEAVMLTSGDGPARKFRVILVRMGRAYEDVSRYNFEIEGDPTNPAIESVINSWLTVIRGQLDADTMRRYRT